MEWSAGLLCSRPDLSITDIAYQLGFSDSAVFSRTFKNFFEMSPKEFRLENSNNCKEISYQSQYNRTVDDKSSKVFGTVKINSIDKLSVIYNRKTGSYGGLEPYTDTLGYLFQYAMKKGLLDKGISLPLTIYHNSPEITSDDNQRTSICLMVKSSTENINSDEIGFMEIPPGLYAIVHFEIEQNEYPSAWDYVYKEWLPASGYLPRNSFPFEVYLNNPMEHPFHKHCVDIYIPVEPIRK